MTDDGCVQVDCGASPAGGWWSCRWCLNDETESVYNRNSSGTLAAHHGLQRIYFATVIHGMPSTATVTTTPQQTMSCPPPAILLRGPGKLLISSLSGNKGGEMFHNHSSVGSSFHWSSTRTTIPIPTVQLALVIILTPLCIF